MGWSVGEVKQASIWEFFSAWNGYLSANSPKVKGVQTEEDADALLDRLMAAPNAPKVLSTQTYTLDGLRLMPAGVVAFEGS